jgi:hypothetical protein
LCVLFPVIGPLEAAPTTAAGTAAAAARRALLEAVTAVHRAVAARLEWDLGLAAATGALRGIHLARAGRVSAAPTAASAVAPATAHRVAAGGLAGTAAVRTAFRLVGESTAGVELLVIRGEDELRSAVYATQRSVGEWHQTTSLERFLVV